jgi:hypothetical protein
MVCSYSDEKEVLELMQYWYKRPKNNLLFQARMCGFSQKNTNRYNLVVYICNKILTFNGSKFQVTSINENKLKKH